MQQQHRNKDEHLWKLTKGYKEGYTPDVEKGLKALKGKIAHSDASTPIIPIGKRNWLMRAASIAILVIGSIFLYQQVANNTPEALVIASNAATVSVHQLPDGTKIWLNKDSKLTHPVHFSDGKRTVHLEGEAYLQVVSDPLKPFIVQTKETAVEVLGTAFSIRAYPNEQATTISVTEGTVSFAAISAGKKRILQAKEKGIYQKETQQLVKTATKTIADLAWKEQKLVFDNTPISEILDYLNTQFDITVTTTNDYGNCPLTATLVDNHPDAILKRITSTFQIEVEHIESKKYQLSGACE